MSKKDDELGVSSFYQDKTSVLQEARVFNESPISPRKCRILLTKVVYLLYTGQTFSSHEATQLFFGATKLFQHKDPALRQMVYLAIKELCPFAEDIIMVTASIMKDMQPNMEVIYRPNAIRALSRVVDPSMVQGLERFFKSAIVDRNSSISSAALVSSYQLHVAAKEVVRRWGNEAQEAINVASKGSVIGSSSGGGGGGFGGGFGGAGSYFGLGGSGGGSGYGTPAEGGPNGSASQQVIPSSAYIAQYHALGLLYLIRAGDRMAVTRLVQQLSGAANNGGRSASQQLRSPFAICMLVRYAAKVAEEDPNVKPVMIALLEGWLKHKAEMVVYESAKAICEMKGVTEAELFKPISILQLFLSSTKVVLKFAAIRTLAKLAESNPKAVGVANIDMENLISDSNRSIATYAITTLLKTGDEESVDRLMKTISTFMSEISDEFKIVVVSAIRSLCLKFPSKQASMLSFLANVLRDEGGYEFKREIIDSIFDMINFIPQCKESALNHLCEFIEDCEFTKLSVRILFLLGEEGPKMKDNQKYIRFIYNRVILENAIVRAAAVSSLAKFGTRSKDLGLRKRIQVLLNRCLDDVDDEVRDRAAMYVRVVREADEVVQNFEQDQSQDASTSSNQNSLSKRLARDEPSYNLLSLESQLSHYVNEGSSSNSAAFDPSSVPTITKEESRLSKMREKEQKSKGVAMATEYGSAGPSEASTSKAASTSVPGAPTGQVGAASAYEDQLKEVPQFANYGKVLKSSEKVTMLTEDETEYTVGAVKHVFKDHVVLQFNVTNTIPDTVLENVEMIVSGTDDSGLTEDFIIPIPQLSPSSPSDVIFVSFSPSDPSSIPFPQGTFACNLRFVSKEVDPSSGEPEEEGYSDEYQVEELDLTGSDYIISRWGNFEKEWEEKGLKEGKETFALTALESLKVACDTLIPLLGLQPLGGSETPSSTSIHTLALSGSIVPIGPSSGNSLKPRKVLARARMTFQAGEGVTMELSVRGSEDKDLELILGAIA